MYLVQLEFLLPHPRLVAAGDSSSSSSLHRPPHQKRRMKITVTAKFTYQQLSVVESTSRLSKMFLICRSEDWEILLIFIFHRSSSRGHHYRCSWLTLCAVCCFAPAQSRLTQICLWDKRGLINNSLIDRSNDRSADKECWQLWTEVVTDRH